MKTYTKKCNGYDLTNIDEVEIYKLLLNGCITRFPKHFIDCDDAKDYMPRIIRYLFTDILRWDRNQIIHNARKDTFCDYKLSGVLSSYYNSSPYAAIIDAFGNDFIKPWDLINAPNNYWQGPIGRENAIKATKELLGDTLNWSVDDIRNNISHKTFSDHNLSGMLKRAYKSSLWSCLEAAYPGVFKQWEVGCHVANNYWTIESGLEALKWLLEVKLKWTDDDIRNKYSKQIFKDNDLYGMIQRCFNSSPFLAINALYPNKFKPYELNCSPWGYWSEDNCKDAINWLVLVKLNITSISQQSLVTKNTLIDNGFSSILNHYSMKDISRWITDILIADAQEKPSIC